VEFRDLLGTELPILQAPMAGVQGSDLAIAVSRAGGLGALPCAMLSASEIRQELTRIVSVSRAPCNVNFFCHQPPAPDPERENAWRATLAPYYRELAIEPTPSSAGSARAPFDESAAAVLDEFRPDVVSFHFGLPAPDLLRRVKANGSRIISSATTVDEARWLEAHGADAIIAQGSEAGGHRGCFQTLDVTTQVGTLALVPQIVRAVSVPVIAAGGIADASGVKAALALGAIAVQVGTSYLLCQEATTSAVHRRALEATDARHTAVTNVFTGRPARGIVNRMIRELGPMRTDVPAFPLPYDALAPLRRQAEALGRNDFSPMWAGQNTTGCQPGSAFDLTRSLAR
jgi:nitronate monooxygenase